MDTLNRFLNAIMPLQAWAALVCLGVQVDILPRLALTVATVAMVEAWRRGVVAARSV
jgi:hypothetical protein